MLDFISSTAYNKRYERNYMKVKNLVDWENHGSLTQEQLKDYELAAMFGIGDFCDIYHEPQPAWLTKWKDKRDDSDNLPESPEQADWEDIR